MNLRLNNHKTYTFITGCLLTLAVILGTHGLLFAQHPTKNIAEKKAARNKKNTTATRNHNAVPDLEPVQEIILKGLNMDLIPGYFFKEEVRNYVYESFKEFYQQRNYHLAWHTLQQPLPQADSLLAALEQAPEEGLFYNYHIEELTQEQHAVFDNQSNEFAPDSMQLVRIARLDFNMTASYLTYASNLLSGKVNPDRFDATWIAHPRKRDLAPLLENAIAHNRIKASLQQVMPNYRQYAALKEALANYRSIEAAGNWPVLPADTTLHMGDSSTIVPLLKRRLYLTHDLSAGSDYMKSNLFDEPLKEAIKTYQRRNGLMVDGIAGENTIAMMNIPVEKRIEQIRINLERLRWLSDTLHTRYVEVNVPEFRLRVKENERQVMEMKVIVGKEYHSTPVFRDTIRYIEFSPTWTVPLSIAQQEILPKLQKDPNYLSRNHFIIYKSWHTDEDTIHYADVNWQEIKPEDFNYRVVQQPGTYNSLGLIKFMFPNKLAIYLHDTPADYLFDRKKRAFSHGCVRVARPVDLALYLLQGLPEWDRQKIQDHMHLDEPETVFLPEPVPVQFVYRTAFVDDDGLMNFRRDIYGHDAVQIEAIQ